MNYLKKFLFSLIIGVSFFVMPNLLENVKAEDITIYESNFNLTNLRYMTDEQVLELGTDFQYYIKLRNKAKELTTKDPEKYYDYIITRPSSPSGYWRLYLYKSDYLDNAFITAYFYEQSNNSSKDTETFDMSLIFNRTNASLFERYHVSNDYTNGNVVQYSNYMSKIFVNDVECLGVSIGSFNLKFSGNNYTLDKRKLNVYYDSSLPIYLQDNVRGYSSRGSYTETKALNIGQEDGNILSYDTGQMIINVNGQFNGNIIPINYEEKERFRYNELGENLSKVEVTFKEKAMTVLGQAHFKINYKIRNYDPDDPNVMKITGYKIYGANTNAFNDPIWEEITENEQEYFSDIGINKISDIEYEYTATFNTPKDLCVHDQYKIEFYFENARYYDVTVYDDLEKYGSTILEEISHWDAYLNFLSDYRYYTLNGANPYAFISSNKTDNVGRIYLVANDSTLLGTEIYNYNFSSKELGTRYFPQIYENNTIYYYLDFHFNYDNNEILFLKKEISSSTSNWIGFWVHKDYYVSTVMPDDNNFQYNTPDNGFQNGNKDDLDDFFYPSSSNNIFDFFTSNKNISEEIGNIIDTVWNYFKKNQISGYILLLIGGTLIIVLINGFNR